MPETKSYADPNCTIRREHCAGEVGGAATTAYGKFASFQKARLKKVHATVTTAGTNAGHGLDIYVGTSSVGTIAMGTVAAATDFSSVALNQTINSLDQVSVRTLVDATGRAVVVYEFEVLPDAVQSS